METANTIDLGYHEPIKVIQYRAKRRISHPSNTSVYQNSEKLSSIQIRQKSSCFVDIVEQRDANMFLRSKTNRTGINVNQLPTYGQRL